MKILITGICGFVGAVIAQALREEQPTWKIFGIDNLSRKGSIRNYPLLRSKGISVTIGDISRKDQVEQLPAADWVLDCAANPSVLAGTSAADFPPQTGIRSSPSRELLNQNLVGTINLLEFCRSHQAGFILLSTSRVYSVGQLARLPLVENGSRFSLRPDSHDNLPPGISFAGVTEEFSLAPPLSLYGSSKLCSEWLALEYSYLFKFPVWLNRCGVLAGAGQFARPDQGIFSFWIHAWLAKRPLRFLGFGGKGLQVRDCLHPSDLVSVILSQINKGSHDQSIPPICNFSGGASNSLSLLELSDWCEAHLGPCPPECDPRRNSSGLSADRPYDVPWLVLDSARAARVWQWAPTRPVSYILEEIASHAREHPHWLEETC